jgi:excisionase family DNA binding protein
MQKKKPMLRQSPPPRVSQLLTINQVAARLHVHRTTVYGFIKYSGLKVTRLAPHAVRVDEADLKAWIDQRKGAS